MEGELPDRLVASDRQLFLSAIFFSTSSFVKVTAARIHMDAFTVFGPSLPEDGVILEEFDSLGKWQPLGTTGSIPDSMAIAADAALPPELVAGSEPDEGSSGLAFSWQEPFGGEQRGIHVSPVPLPLPAIGGVGLSEGQSLRIEHGRAAIPIKVVGVSDLFPTVTSFHRPFLLLDINSYQSYLRILPPASVRPSPPEIWLSLDPAYERRSVIADVTQLLPPLASVTDRQREAVKASRNPLAGGGWNGLTGLSMAGIGLVVLTALLLHSRASARAGSVDTAVAKALGMSNPQLFLSLGAEKWLMGGVAIVTGAAIGYWPGLELVRLLDPTSRGTGPVPPMIPDVHGLLLFSVLIGLAAALVASTVLAAILAHRAKPFDVLRGVA